MTPMMVKGLPLTLALPLTPTPTPNHAYSSSKLAPMIVMGSARTMREKSISLVRVRVWVS